jgi:cystine transport system ATP-binding protein
VSQRRSDGARARTAGESRAGGKETSYPRRFPAGSSSVWRLRALAMRPDVILFDEPTSALDPELVGGAQHHSPAGAGKTHDGDRDHDEMSFARDVADRAILWIRGALLSRASEKLVR